MLQLRKKTLLTLFSFISFGWACSPEDNSQLPIAPPSSQPSPLETQATDMAPSTAQLPEDVLQIMSHGCLPCHAQGALKSLIQQTERASFESAGNMTRERILNALQKLEGEKQEGSFLNFSTPEQVFAYISAKPQTFIISLENNTMPPEWADEMSQKIDSMGYRPLSVEERIILLKFARTFL